MTRARAKKATESDENAPQTDEETEEVQDDQTTDDSASEGDDDTPDGATDSGGTPAKFEGGVAVVDSEGNEIPKAEEEEAERETPEVDYDRNPRPEGKILQSGDPVQFDGEKVGNMVIVKEDVYREVVPFRSKRPTYLLIYAKGTAIPETAVENQSDESE